MEKLTAFLRSYPNAKILDVGTGSGQFIDLVTSLDEGYGEIIGIDISEPALAAARKAFANRERIRFEKMDVLDMTYQDASFDVVFLSNSLHHLSQIPATIHAMERVIKPHGALLINEMRSDELSPRQISHRLLHHFAAKVDRMLGLTHDETFSKAAILQLLETNSSFSIDATWDLTYDHPEENTPEELTHLLATIDRLVARIPDDPRRPAMVAEAETIRQYIQTHGFDSATEFLVVLKKA